MLEEFYLELEEKLKKIKERELIISRLEEEEKEVKNKILQLMEEFNKICK